MNTQEAKIVLETALLTAERPLRWRNCASVLADELKADTLRVLLDELRTDWSGRGVELVRWPPGWRFQAGGDARCTSTG